MSDKALRAVDAIRGICTSGPSLVRDSDARRGVGLYGWNTGPVQEVHIPENGELIVSLHLGGARRVRLFTHEGLTRSFSKPGDITLMPRGKPISFRTDGAVEFATLHFSPESPNRRHADEWARILGQSDCLFAFRDEYVLASVRALMQASRSRSRDTERYCARLLDSLVAHLAMLVERGGPEQIDLPMRLQRGPRQPDFDAVLRQIEQHLADKLTLDELSARAGVSRALFAREFSTRFGCSPHRYLNRRRVERAKQLLREGLQHEGRHSLADIAYEVGFSGQSHFSTIFKSLEGCTPIGYVNALRNS